MTMISQVDLINMLNNLSNYKRKRSELQIFYINQRLEKSLESYCKNLDVDISIANMSNPVRRLKKVNMK